MCIKGKPNTKVKLWYPTLKMNPCDDNIPYKHQPMHDPEEMSHNSKILVVFVLHSGT